MECLEVKPARDCIEEILEGDNPIQSVHHINVRQSMKNGGGPACLRLRVVLSEDELAALRQGVLLGDGLYDELCAWIEKHYRHKLHPHDLADPNLLHEGRTALDELTQILGLGSVYSFQGA
jgi:succinylarginine dihydrolase